jgi:hypothetical protein
MHTGAQALCHRCCQAAQLSRTVVRLASLHWLLHHVVMPWCGAGGEKSAAMARVKRGARAESAEWSRRGHGAYLASIRRLYAS